MPCTTAALIGLTMTNSSLSVSWSLMQSLCPANTLTHLLSGNSYPSAMARKPSCLAPALHLPCTWLAPACLPLTCLSLALHLHVGGQRGEQSEMPHTAVHLGSPPVQQGYSGLMLRSAQYAPPRTIKHLDCSIITLTNLVSPSLQPCEQPEAKLHLVVWNSTVPAWFQRYLQVVHIHSLLVNVHPARA